MHVFFLNGMILISNNYYGRRSPNILQLRFLVKVQIINNLQFIFFTANFRFAWHNIDLLQLVKITKATSHIFLYGVLDFHKSVPFNDRNGCY